MISYPLGISKNAMTNSAQPQRLKKPNTPWIQNKTSSYQFATHHKTLIIVVQVPSPSMETPQNTHLDPVMQLSRNIPKAKKLTNTNHYLHHYHLTQETHPHLLTHQTPKIYRIYQMLLLHTATKKRKHTLKLLT